MVEINRSPAFLEQPGILVYGSHSVLHPFLPRNRFSPGLPVEERALPIWCSTVPHPQLPKAQAADGCRMTSLDSGWLLQLSRVGGVEDGLHRPQLWVFVYKVAMDGLHDGRLLWSPSQPGEISRTEEVWVCLGWGSLKKSLPPSRLL